jgi:hypothetical protein
LHGSAFLLKTAAAELPEKNAFVRESPQFGIFTGFLVINMHISALATCKPA